MERGIRDGEWVSEITKRNAVVPTRGKFAYGRRVCWWEVAPRRRGKTDEVLGRERVGVAARFNDRVSESIVHRCDARSVWMTEIGDLHGREPSREKREPIRRRMTGEIYENIRRIGADRVFHRRRRLTA